MPNVEPFIRWAGGKTWLIKYLRQILQGVEINHYHEPFLGGAAIFFAIEHKSKSYLSDLNEELISTYLAIRDYPEEVIDFLREYKNTEDDYYRIRNLKSNNSIERAAQFIYLNQTSFNGIYRVNKSGQYNVPYGFRKSWNYDAKRIIEASSKLQNTRISCGDFTTNLYRIKEKDLVFLDPPYTVSHNNNGFIEYNKNLFSLDDQKRLSKFIQDIKKKNAYYILTNAAHPAIQEIFGNEQDRQIELKRNSLIGGKNAVRQEISEYIFTNISKGETFHE